MCFFSNLGQFLEINYFLTQYYNRKGEKICNYAIPPISQEPHECGKLSGVQIFLVQKSRKWPQDHYFFTESAILPIFDPILQREGGKNMDFRYTTYIKRTSRLCQAICGPDIFGTKKVENGLRIIIFTKSAILPIFDPILILQQEGKKKSGPQIYHPYHKNLMSVASYLGYGYF